MIVLNLSVFDFERFLFIFDPFFSIRFKQDPNAFKFTNWIQILSRFMSDPDPMGLKYFHISSWIGILTKVKEVRSGSIEG